MNAAPGPIVLKLGGSVLDTHSDQRPFFDALVRHAAQSSGGLVLVHGGGAQVDVQLKAMGLASQRKAGLRVTPPEHIHLVAGVLRGSVNAQLVSRLLKHNLPAVGLGLSDGGACQCSRHAPGGEDLGAVGTITSGDGALWKTLLAGGYVPVLCSIGSDASSNLLNVNADDAAVGIARIVHARGLVLLTDVSGICDASGQVIETIETEKVEQLIVSGVIAGGMIPKARAAAVAAQEIGATACITSWQSLKNAAAQTKDILCAGTKVVAPDRPVK